MPVIQNADTAEVNVLEIARCSPKEIYVPKKDLDLTSGSYVTCQCSSWIFPALFSLPRSCLSEDKIR